MGNVWIATADLSQIEMRIAAHISRDPEMIALMIAGADIHARSVRQIYGKTEADVTPAEWKNMRYLGKTAGFGILYKLSAAGLLLRTPGLGLTLERAQEIIDGVYAAFPGLRTMQEDIIAFTRKYGFATTILGRRRYLPDITATDYKYRGEAERAACNVPIQGSAADYFKLCILAVDRRLQETKLRARMVNQVHDEIVFEVHKDDFNRLATEVIPVMAHVYPLRVPVKYDIEFGNNWGDLHEWNRDCAEGNHKIPEFKSECKCGGLLAA